MNTPDWFKDRQLICADCGARFLWSAEAQEFYRAQGDEPPKRCPPCRRSKKAQREIEQQRSIRR